MKGDFGKYFGEHCPITWVSLAQLLIISGLSWRIFKLYKVKLNLHNRRSPHTIWAIIALAFLFLFCDEMFGIHEALDRFIHWGFNIKETPLTDRLDGILIGVYGLVGIASLHYYREELKNYIVIYPFLLIGFVLLFASVGLDILAEQNDIIHNIVVHEQLSVIEESFKVLSEGIFLVGFYQCLQITRRKKITTSNGLKVSAMIVLDNWCRFVEECSTCNFAISKFSILF